MVFRFVEGSRFLANPQILKPAPLPVEDIEAIIARMSLEDAKIITYLLYKRTLILEKEIARLQAERWQPTIAGEPGCDDSVEFERQHGD